MNYIPKHVRDLPRRSAFAAADFIAKYWFRGVLCFFALQIFFNKNVSIQVRMNDIVAEDQITETEGEDTAVAAPVVHKTKPAAPVKALAGVAAPVKAARKTAASRKWKAGDFGNLSFVLNPTLAERKRVPRDIVEIKNDKCRKYVERFARVAIGEMEKFGIPASITLAQGLLESNAGDSKLSNESLNHFGIKCRAKCLGCTCRNYRDDEVYDMFRVFETPWESYREHSVLLNSSRYKHLKNLGTTDYKGWAKGLKKAGYATDKQYAEKLVRIIEGLDLYQFDV